MKFFLTKNRAVILHFTRALFDLQFALTTTFVTVFPLPPTSLTTFLIHPTLLAVLLHTAMEKVHETTRGDMRDADKILA